MTRYIVYGSIKKYYIQEVEANSEEEAEGIAIDSGEWADSDYSNLDEEIEVDKIKKISSKEGY